MAENEAVRKQPSGIARGNLLREFHNRRGFFQKLACEERR